MSVETRLAAALADRYSIDREVGRGGMATVYLARDLKHDRLVALKVLEPDLGAVLGTERFLSEIRVTANLQHPNILPLFDSGEAEGLLYYVMPFIDGESLRARLEREKQLPIDEAIRIASAIASALDYAHRRNVIHRDLKPDNILMLEGQPLVADFGIALAVSNAGGGRITQTGLSLGTPQYMSPEQATGDRHLDGRSDIYSLGAVLYEMLAGEPPHIGATAQAVIAKVLTDKPRSLRLARDRVPVHVEQAVDTALAKLPADRFATGQDFIDALNGRPTLAPMTAAHVAAVHPRRGLAIAVAILVAGVIGFALGGRLRDNGPAKAVPRFFNIALPDSAPFLPGRDAYDDASRALAISPDGRAIVYSAATRAGTQLMMGRLDAGTFAPIRGGESGTLPAFSPDGRAIATLAGTDVKRIALDDGVTTPIGTLAWSNDITWGADGNIYASSYATCVSSVPAAGGRLATPIGPNCHAESFAPIDNDLAVVTLDNVLAIASRSAHTTQPMRAFSASPSTEVRRVTASSPFIVSPGVLAFLRDSTVFAARFDAKAARLTSDPVPILSGVSNDGTVAHLSLAGDGTLLWARGGDGGRGKFVWATRDGKTTDSLFLPREAVGSYALSSDGKRLAYDATGPDGRPRLYVVAIDRKVVDEVSTDLRLQPSDWMDGDRQLIVSVLRRDGTERNGVVAWRNGVASLDTMQERFNAESADRTLRCGGLAGNVEIWKTTAPKARIRLQEGNGSWCRFSPNGRYLSWVSGRSVFVAPTDSDGARNRAQVATDGADEPRWTPDGKQLYFRNAHRWYVVDAPAPGKPASAPRLVFQGHFLQALASWSLGPDGRFLLLAGRDVAPAKTLSVMTNFPAFVEQKLSRAR